MVVQTAVPPPRSRATSRALDADDPSQIAKSRRQGRSSERRHLPETGMAGSRFYLAGVPIDAVDTQETLDRLGAAIINRRPTQVCTVNLDFVVQAQRDPELKQILNQSQLNTPDGFPVVRLGRLMGANVRGRVAGADIVPRLLAMAAGYGARVFLLGGEAGVAEAAARKLADQLPELIIAGWYQPPRAPIHEMDNDAIVDRINRSGADVLLVALGNPKQEKWIARHRARLNVSVALGVGCCLDLIAGRVRRAPRWMQAVELEWLYRLLQEPRRLFSRYLRDLSFLPVLALPIVGQRVRGLVGSRAVPRMRSGGLPLLRHLRR
jgi:N-acetylglucosaminyldiphosphoundecaprenol N-acetyl-beta-D-mannosaminyltransferase